MAYAVVTRNALNLERKLLNKADLLKKKCWLATRLRFLKQTAKNIREESSELPKLALTAR